MGLKVYTRTFFYSVRFETPNVYTTYTIVLVKIYPLDEWQICQPLQKRLAFQTKFNFS